MAGKAFSTYQVADICNVHHTTVINWVNEGKLKAYTTPGGHRRIKQDDLMEFVREYRIPVAEEMIKGPKRVLFVDDDKDLQEEFKQALSGNGFELDFASDGFEAGRKIYRKRPDLILLDFKMPGLDGFQVCEFLNNDKETAGIPIIAITVLKSAEERRRIRECGVREYLPKPVDLEKLLGLIKNILSITTS